MDNIPPGFLLGLLIFLGLHSVSIFAPAWQSSIGELVPRSQIASAVMANAVGFNLARSIGPGESSYTRYDRVIDYAGLRGDMVLLMGEEIVVPKTEDAVSARETHRRFTDLWKLVDGRWKLTARQATIISRP